MANKYFYYVGVQNDHGMILVTSVDNGNRICHWDSDKKPLAMAQSVATDLAEGLCWNFHTAVVVKSLFELNTHFVSKEGLVQKELEKAVDALGYKESVQYLKIAEGRFRVYSGNDEIGIYDLARHTFVD